MRELTVDELEVVDGGILMVLGVMVGAAAVYVGALTLVNSMGTASGEANARRSEQ